MGRDRAAYMREYRASRAVQRALLSPGEFRAEEAYRDYDHAAARIAELEEEVRHLKAELAKRPFQRGIVDERGQDRFNTRPFTPVPKK